MKMRNKILILAILSVLTIPQIASAAWWNPWSWKVFNRSQQVETGSSVETSEFSKQTEEIDNLKKEIEQLKKGSLDEQQKAIPEKIPQKTATPIVPVKATAPPVPVEPQDIVIYRNQINTAYKDQIGKYNKALEIATIIKLNTEYSISDIGDTIVTSEGWKLGNPDISDLINYFIGIYKKQLEFEKKHLSFQEQYMAWLEKTKAGLLDIIVTLDYIKTRNELGEKMSIISLVDENLKKAASSATKWSDESNRMELTIKGIVAGASSYHSSNSRPKVTPVYPSYTIPTYIPSNKINCTSKINAIGELQTSCY